MMDIMLRQPTGIEMNRVQHALINTCCSLEEILETLALDNLDTWAVTEGLTERLMYRCKSCLTWLYFLEAQPRDHEFCFECDRSWLPCCREWDTSGGECDDCIDPDCGCAHHDWAFLEEGFFPSDMGWCGECGVDLAFEEHARGCFAMSEEEMEARGIPPEEAFMLDTRAVYWTVREGEIPKYLLLKCYDKRLTERAGCVVINLDDEHLAEIQRRCKEANDFIMRRAWVRAVEVEPPVLFEAYYYPRAELAAKLSDRDWIVLGPIAFRQGTAPSGKGRVVVNVTFSVFNNMVHLNGMVAGGRGRKVVTLRTGDFPFTIFGAAALDAAIMTITITSAPCAKEIVPAADAKSDMDGAA